MINTSIMISTIIGTSLIGILLIVLVIMLAFCIKKTGLRDNIVHIIFAILIIIADGYMVYYNYHTQSGKIVNKAIVISTIVATENTSEKETVQYYIQIENTEDFVEVSKEQYAQFNTGNDFKYKKGLVKCERF